MTSNPWFYQLLLAALVLVCLIIHVWWPDPLRATPLLPIKFLKPQRKRTVDTQSHFCPDPDCSYHGWRGRGHIRSNGHPSGQPWR